MAGSQFSPLTPCGRELLELQQVERIRARLERELKQATDREREIKNRTARLDTLEADKAALEELDELAMIDAMKVLKSSILSLHAHVDNRLNFMQNSLDQILDLLQRPGLRPAAQSPLPLTAMSGPFPVQAGTQPSGTSAAAAQTIASSSSGPAAGAIPQPQQTVPPQRQQQSPWYPKTPMKPPLAFSGEKKDEELNTWLRTVPMWVRAKRTLQEEEVITAASYLEGKAAKWLDGIVAKAGFGRRMADWGKTLTLEEFLDMVEARWHNPQQTLIATDAMLRLDQRRYKDVRFTSELWKVAAAEQGTQLQMTFGNHPEANGQAEQLNRAVQDLLRHYIKPNQVDWDEKLALIASLYNNAVHSATGVSPNSLLLTFKPRLPLDFLLPENQTTAAPGTLAFAYRYEQKMQQVVEQMQKAQAAMIESENRHRRPSTFQVGDRVWVKSSELGQEHGISRKLMPQYFGPWEVLDIVGTDPDGPSYVIRIPGHLRTYPVFHASKLAPFKETDEFPSRRSMLPPTTDGEVDIDDIVDHRAGRPKPKLQYRVWFRHHTDPKEDRWFTREELMQTAPQVVAHYEKSLQKGKRPMVED
ncbi:hypothetical protein CBR_g23769 [Chara braunii]|uniref:Integrase catalytic domain-containing protein n=1 Tax=Chara braunii TaxID=69332 RepID=A0A388JVI7_CHABU|nr:hypothetical protein CBR_g23769 [Chara braunii]|eukprot:GBG61811.1 hypothetical protein CBR_g23769 [Chara braunii]